ncbi:MAG: FAD-dependent oxidoreductase [Candidatus Margulisiibacteriota bacterium]
MNPSNLRIAIVGSGPSGFYVADALFKLDASVTIDMFERLPTPYGLLRAGVAPDHQKMKSVCAYFERVAQHIGFGFWGNVVVGKDVSIAELQGYYDIVVITTGAQTDKKLNIPGEHFLGSYTATEFVAWYNAHPDYQDRRFNLDAESVAIIGLGNVAIDVTRVLAKTPEELSTSDITATAMDALKNSHVKEIHLIGRRGPAQSAFTELEIKELGHLGDCDCVVSPADLILNDQSQAEVDDPANAKARKNMAVLQELAAQHTHMKRKKIVLHFLRTPVEIFKDGVVSAIRLEKNKLVGDAGRQKAVGTGEFVDLPCQMILRSVGYQGVPVEGVPFDLSRGIIPNQHGRVTTPNGGQVPGLYVSGWIKRGASGVIGTNKPDGQETASSIMADAPSLHRVPHRDSAALRQLLITRGVRTVGFSDWKRIDSEEQARGKMSGKPREKMTKISDMLAFLSV